jgi:hypothetical protein
MASVMPSLLLQVLGTANQSPAINTIACFSRKLKLRLMVNIFFFNAETAMTTFPLGAVLVLSFP